MPAAQKAAPASAEKQMLAMEIWLGVMLVAASQRVTAAAQPVWRLASGRLFSSSAKGCPPDTPERRRVDGGIDGGDAGRQRDGRKDFRRAGQRAWIEVSSASDRATAISGGRTSAAMPEKLDARRSIMRFSTKVMAPDSAPCTTPATSGCGHGCARLARTAQPPIARKATAIWTREFCASGLAKLVSLPPTRSARDGRRSAPRRRPSPACR